ncbi:hypothetical protein ON010_g1516 [Phytophthora cinnamomi]|nr:hypothetical protein ON010_g1516 [Phytophthora cinnamomi]
MFQCGRLNRGAECRQRSLFVEPARLVAVRLDVLAHHGANELFGELLVADLDAADGAASRHPAFPPASLARGPMPPQRCCAQCCPIVPFRNVTVVEMTVVEGRKQRTLRERYPTAHLTDTQSSVLNLYSVTQETQQLTTTMTTTSVINRIGERTTFKNITQSTDPAASAPKDHEVLVDVRGVTVNYRGLAIASPATPAP